jgi:hypothetical protein
MTLSRIILAALPYPVKTGCEPAPTIRCCNADLPY